MSEKEENIEVVSKDDESSEQEETKVMTIKVIKRPVVPKQIRGMISSAFMRREE